MTVHTKHYSEGCYKDVLRAPNADKYPLSLTVAIKFTPKKLALDICSSKGKLETAVSGKCPKWEPGTKVP